MNDHYPFINIPLPYAYNALEPYIDTKTMIVHHQRHLQTYINTLNGLLRKFPYLHKLTLTQLLTNPDILPKELQVPIQNHAGGVYNHRFFFDSLKNPGERYPIGLLRQDLIQQFGNLTTFLMAFRIAALSVFGSGYVWLILSDKKLDIITTPNQNTPLPMGYCPLINLDLWEHAYYLKNLNNRAAYIDNWFRVADWAKAEQRYLACLRKSNER